MHFVIKQCFVGVLCLSSSVPKHDWRMAEYSIFRPRVMATLFCCCCERWRIDDLDKREWPPYEIEDAAMIEPAWQRAILAAKIKKIGR